jgi:diguanylate cyclase (GGDEF)-like protein/PAS domain S-box-containing protein
MARTVEAFAATPNPKPVSELLDVNGELMFRTVYPMMAHEQSCVNCHNALQPGKARWNLDDVMGAFVIDVPTSAFLHTVMWQSTGIGLGLFLALALAGLTISFMHFRQLEALDASAAELGRTQNFLDNIIENMPLSVAVKDARDRCYVLINRTAEAIFGIARSDLIGRRARHASDKETGADLFPLAGEALSTRELQTIDEHVVHTHHNGTRVLTTKNLSISDETGEPRYLLSLSEDITERKQAEALIQHLAHYDALTDLPNRAAFVEHLTRTIDAAAASNESFAVLSIDLDRFKEVNDIFGHAVGDDLLRELSQQLRALAVDAGANLARLGGDEFTLISSNGDHPALAEILARRLHAAPPRPSWNETASVCASASASASRSFRPTAPTQPRCSTMPMPRSPAPRLPVAARRASLRSKWTTGSASGAPSSMNFPPPSRATSSAFTISRWRRSMDG